MALLAALCALPAIEALAHGYIVASVPARQDWVSAADAVRKGASPEDLITVAPEWADPILREHLGKSISIAQAAPSDLAPFPRVFLLSIRGAGPEDVDGLEALVGRDPDLDRSFGAVRLRRYDLGESPVLYDFVSHIGEAKVDVVRGGRPVPCTKRRGMPLGGGLGRGALTPAERFVCDPRIPWLYVGATVVEDLDLEPRRCVYQHAPGPEPLRATFEDVPLGDRIVFYGGLYYEHERMREHGPIDAAVFIDDQEVGRMRHHDGDGWKRMEISTHPPGLGWEGKTRGNVRVEVSAPNNHLRAFCWYADVREGDR